MSRDLSGLSIVFDCKIFLQALGSPEGPAGKCVQLAFDRKILLFLSAFVLEELRLVVARPRVIAKLHLKAERVDEFLETLERVSVVLESIPAKITYQRDPADEGYINLALAAKADLIVTRDRDLLDFMNAAFPESADFQRRYPWLQVVDPVQLLRRVGAVANGIP